MLRLPQMAKNRGLRRSECEVCGPLLRDALSAEDIPSNLHAEWTYLLMTTCDGYAPFTTPNPDDDPDH